MQITVEVNKSNNSELLMPLKAKIFAKPNLLNMKKEPPIVSVDQVDENQSDKTTELSFRKKSSSAEPESTSRYAEKSTSR